MKRSGFTLLELIIVIAVLAITLGFVLFSFPSIQISGRDTKRLSDLKQYASSLETYSNVQNGLYPSYNGDIILGSGNTQLCTALGVSGTCPYDPKDIAPNRYHYVSNGTGGGSNSATQYVLYVQLEKQTSGSNWLWVVCSNGQVGRASTSTTFPGAACPTNLVQ